jgi:hypothetical protein
VNVLVYALLGLAGLITLAAAVVGFLWLLQLVLNAEESK